MLQRSEWSGDYGDVKPIGRTYSKDGIRWLALSGSGIEFICETELVEIAIVSDSSVHGQNGTDYARFAMYINEELVFCDTLREEQKTVKIFESIEKQEITVRILKISEAPHSMIGIEKIILHSDIPPKKTEDLAHKIEFIGDSITCGYGVDAESELIHFTTATEDVTKAYAYLTSKALNSDYSMVSYSGYGIVSGYTENDKKDTIQIVPKYYQSVARCFGTFKDLPLLENIPWDFSKYIPELIVINLGTNDNTYCKDKTKRHEEYRDEYVKFLKVVREKNMDATILCALGLMGANLYPMVEEAVALYQSETKDDNIVTFQLTEQDKADGYGADWHPSKVAHQKAAKQLTEEIKKIMGW
ncbi:SGNH/GDSL hydrolase family protein [Lachnoclostridium phytofermentans]|uniref:Lipolytic protein G-D-S-L family n=1 Tax=Lachnoclostridium phytofermentans (strain ATCC 700394 / DSM 18823 / ISDg) TaxID=357809 RepID=A9KNN1_LACP7|nr:SGNH/GDSL hydrolase family protein [Lachnoclostridium phytofermentans]ABX41632.1 lipolytic protein G-D-S-L family [Lachnoclostridium phytofermentans ISDg]